MKGPGGGDRLRREVQKPVDGWKTAARLAALFAGERRHLALVAALVLVGSGLGLLLPWLIGRVIDGLVQGTPTVAILAALAAAALLDAALSWGESRLLARLVPRVVAQIRRRLFDAFAALPTAVFDRATPGDLMSRMTNDVDNLGSTATQSTLTLLGGSVQMVAVLALMLALSPLLTLVALGAMLLVLSLSQLLAARTRAHFRRQQALLGRVNTLVEESLTGYEVVEAFGRRGAVGEEFRQANQALSDAGRRAQLWAGLLMPLMNVINNLSFALVAWVGGSFALEGVLTVGTVATFLLYSRQFARPVNELANVWASLQTALAGAERVFAVLDEAPEADEAAAVELHSPRGRVEFRDVGFAYRPDRPVLSGLNIVIPEGTSLALVGPTGSGKTTVANLLMRFYDVTSGALLIEGRDVRTYTRASLRRHFGVVLQEAWLFRGTIEQNIAFGKPGASFDEVRQAAERARCDAFVRHLPLGYQTPLTENGSPLSQGQRQLVAIARALLADPAFLILDEATSNVDTRTELLLQTAVREALKGRTSVLIAHRLTTIRDADRIVFLENGRVQESGTHDELLAAQGPYSRMLRYQRSASADETADASPESSATPRG